VKRTFGGWHRSALAVVWAAAAGSSMFGSAPAYADHTPGTQSEGVQFGYAPPTFSWNHDHINWHWTLKNTGPGRATHVTLTHRLDPALRVTAVSAPCTTVGTVVSCPFDVLTPGEERHGVIEADLPPGQAAVVQINGQVAWEQAASPEGVPATPATVVHG
jgi:hypothetical protein